MALLSGSSLQTIVYLIALYSMCHEIKLVEGRFLWDLSNYCINYCSRFSEQMPRIGVCSCHRIASYHRRMTGRDLETIDEQTFQNSNFNEPIDNYI
ncbi:unnamed protein product [Adineta steineri]|uniref:Uncharacterized protein n=1 Tax=Adineta steineri TaxID=433720 RepID=A0A813YB16_9BILA|nr:unnamed protein product [Adineta steineri]CAF3499999.1 unnamed protein product [Adineta steineri]